MTVLDMQEREVEARRIAALFADDRLARALAEGEGARHHVNERTSIRATPDPLLERLAKDPDYLLRCSRGALSI